MGHVRPTNPLAKQPWRGGACITSRVSAHASLGRSLMTRLPAIFGSLCEGSYCRARRMRFCGQTLTDGPVIHDTGRPINGLVVLRASIARLTTRCHTHHVYSDWCNPAAACVNLTYQHFAAGGLRPSSSELSVSLPLVIPASDNICLTYVRAE
jgi:hypothetical protein